MKIVLMIIVLLTNNRMIRELACVEQTKCDSHGICATKWVCPLGVQIVEPVEVQK